LSAPASAAPLYSRGFQVYNYVPYGLDYTVELNDLSGGGRFEGAPTPPKTLAMGDHDDYELQVHPAEDGENDIARYDITPNHATGYSTSVYVNMSTDNVGEHTNASCSVIGSDPKENFTCDVNNNHDPVIVTINAQAK
jgi:hypothetical protein